MTDGRLWHFIIAAAIVLLPVYVLFAIGFVLLPAEQWMTIIFFAGLVTMSLFGCGITGEYDSGPIWHYHGTPEYISRPDIEKLRDD